MRGLLGRIHKRFAPDRQQLLVDAAALAILADREVKEVELDTASRLLTTLPWFRGVEPEAMRTRLHRAIETLRDEDDLYKEMRALAQQFEDPDAREAILGICAFILWCDDTLTQDEQDWLITLNGNFGFSQAHLEELLEDIRAYLAEYGAFQG